MRQPVLWVTALLIIVSASGSATVAAASVAQEGANALPSYRIRLGDFWVTALSDQGESPQIVKAANGTKAPNTMAMKPANAYVVSTGEKVMLIDSGAGTLLGPAFGGVMRNLRAAGLQPEQVDDIYLTRLQPDRIGGLLWERKAVFPRAIVHASAAEADYWLSKSSMAAAPVEQRQLFAEVAAVLKPYLATRRLLSFPDEGKLATGIRALASGGQATYVIESRGERMIFVGDSAHPDAAMDGDWVVDGHLPFPGIGHLRAVHGAYRFVPLK